MGRRILVPDFEETGEIDHDMLSMALYRRLLEEVPEQVRLIMEEWDECELEPQYLGFVAPYYLLSLLIPKHWRVIDFGCHAAAQAYYFREHLSYLGVDSAVPSFRRFTFGNTQHMHTSVKGVLQRYRYGEILGEYQRDQTFAICNAVPPGSQAHASFIAEFFPNLHVFYPSGPTLFEMRNPWADSPCSSSSK